MNESGNHVWIPVAVLICILLIAVTCATGLTNIALTSGTETLITTTRMDSEQGFPVIDSDRIVWQSRDPLNYTFDIFFYNVTSGQEIFLTPYTPGTDQKYPSIYDDLVVWEDNRNMNSDIYLYNLSNGLETLITPNTTESDQKQPGIYGNRVIWQDNRNGNWEIYLYDVSTTKETRISNGTSDALFPDIFGFFIVWQSWDERNLTYEIFEYNIEDGTTILLTPNTTEYSEEYPRIFKNYVIWQEKSTPNGTTDYNVNMYDITSREIEILTPNTTNSQQKFPVIFNNTIIWQDNRNGIWNLFLYDLMTGTTSMLTNGTADQTRPEISGDRIVWQDWRSGVPQIYLFTLGVSKTCPIADFTANTTFGVLPLSVSFTDESIGDPTHWSWDFGDGTGSDERNITHTYINPGIYTVTLTVNTPYCRDTKRIEKIITVGTHPSAQFSLNKTEGVAPLMVECTDESSGEPNEWAWDFGDGTNSTDQNPVHQFGPGIYTIRLNASNQFGSTVIEKTDIIIVVNGTNEQISWNISGIEVLNEGERQLIVVNTTRVPIKHFNETQLELSGSAEGNLEFVRFFSGNNSIFVKSTNTTIEGNISGLAIESGPIGPADEVLFDLIMPYYEQNGSIQSIFWENITPLDLEASRQAWFNITYGDVTGGAYTVQFLKTGINQTGPARIRMAVNSSWVKAQEPLYGSEISSDPVGANVYVDGVFKGVTPISIAGPTAGTHQLVIAKDGYKDTVQPIFLGGIRIIRIGDDGVSEVLPTRYLYSDPEKNLDYFEADSPNGLSKFTVAGLSYSGNPFQLLVLTITRYLTGSGGGGGGGGGSSSGSTTTPSPTATETSTISSTGEGINPEITITPEPSVPQGEPTTMIPEEPVTPEPSPTAPPPMGPLGIIIGMFAWLETILKGRMVFILAAVAITVVSVIAIWKKGYLGRE